MLCPYFLPGRDLTVIRSFVPFLDKHIVTELFSQAIVAGEPLPPFTNFHDTLTNSEQTPSAKPG
jgi:hypothetical protein